MQDNSNIQDYVFKFILVGNCATGKTSIVHYFLKNQHKQNTTQTVGVEFASKLITFQGKQIKLQIWDTAGQERFRSIARTYYRNAIAAFVVYDITNYESYESLENWISDARDNSKQDLDILVIGNKSDLKDRRAVSYEEAEKFVRSQNALYIETSALNGENIEAAFLKLVDHIYNRVQQGGIEPDEYKPQLLNPLTKKATETTNENQRGCGC